VKAGIRTAILGSIDMTLGQHRGAEQGGVIVFGVGGAGGNAVRALLQRPECGMRIVCANTDVQAMRAVPVANRLQLGRHCTAGLGAGGRPEIGRAAAEEALPEIVEALRGASLCFIAAGLGGGTGTGAAPIIAKAARDLGILTVGVATKPFAFEGKRRARTADLGAADLRAQVDVMVTVCNQKLLEVAGRDTTLSAALRSSDSIIGESATDFALLLQDPALKRVGVADMRTLLASTGDAVIGFGERCAGSDRAIDAARSALCNPLLEGLPGQARRLLVTVAGGEDLTLFEVEEAITCLRTSVAEGTELVWGAVIDPELAGRVRVGIVAGGIPIPEPVPPMPAAYVLQPSREVPTEIVAAPATVCLNVEEFHPVAPRPTVVAEQPELVLTAALAMPPVASSQGQHVAGEGLVRRTYDAARAMQQRWKRAPRTLASTAVPPSVFHVLKPFDPPARPAVKAGNLIATARIAMHAAE
jgi:cell division protein FtsZ